MKKSLMKEHQQFPYYKNVSTKYKKIFSSMFNENKIQSRWSIIKELVSEIDLQPDN